MNLTDYTLPGEGGQHDEKIKRYKKIITYLKELQEARKTFRKTREMLNMWDDL